MNQSNRANKEALPTEVNSHLPAHLQAPGFDQKISKISKRKHKTTILPDFTETVPNFHGLYRENYEVSRNAELSRIHAER